MSLAMIFLIYLQGICIALKCFSVLAIVVDLTLMYTAYWDDGFLQHGRAHFTILIISLIVLIFMPDNDTFYAAREWLEGLQQ